MNNVSKARKAATQYATRTVVGHHPIHAEQDKS